MTKNSFPLRAETPKGNKLNKQKLNSENVLPLGTQSGDDFFASGKTENLRFPIFPIATQFELKFSSTVFMGEALEFIFII